jgi:adenylate cyclase
VHRRGYRLNMAQALATSTSASDDLPVTIERTISLGSTVDRPAAPRAVPLALAVMPFSSREGDERSERFAKTFAGDLLSKFTFNSEVPLISRQASFAFQGQSLSAIEIARRVQARYVVTGQVQLIEGTIDWTLEMLDGETNRVVWSENSRANFDDVKIELDNILRRIAGTIHNYFFESKLIRAWGALPSPEEPYKNFARIAEVMFRLTPETAAEAQHMSEVFVAEQPRYALAWAIHCNTHVLDMHNCLTGLWKDDRIAEILAEVNRAIELDRTYALSYGLLAQALCLNGQFDEAQVVARKAQELAPSDVIQLAHLAHVHFFSGRLDHALRCAEQALVIAPSRPGANMPAHRGRALVFLGRVTEGIELLSEFVLLVPGHNWVRMALIVALEESGSHEKAAFHYAELLKYTRNFDYAFFGRRWSAIPEIRDRYIRALGAHGFS